MIRVHRLVGFAAAAWLAVPGTAPAQPRTVVMVPVPAPAAAVESRIHAVADLDRALAFYRDVVGLPVLEAPTVADGRFPAALVGESVLHARTAHLALPGTGTALLLVEFSGTDRRPQRPRRTDPGAATLLVGVPDVAAVLARAVASGTAVARAPGGGAAVLVDPDGFFVALDGAAGPSGGGRTRMVFTVRDPEAAAAFYRDVLGFALEPPARDAATGAISRVARIPGADLVWEFTAYPGTDRLAHAGRLYDPGTPAVTVRVPNVRVATEAARRAGLPIASAGTEPVMHQAGGAVLVRDPGGLWLELIERRDP